MPKKPTLTPNESAESRKSEGSARSNLEPTTPGSSTSLGTKNRWNVRDWNDKRWSDPASTPGRSYDGHPLDPPRPAKDGMEWVWFPEGYWAEREIRDFAESVKPQNRVKTLFGRSAASSPAKTLSTMTHPSKSIIPKIEVASLKSFKDSSKCSSHRVTNLSSPADREEDDNINELASMDPVFEKLGLYCRAKRNLGSLIGKGDKEVPFNDAATISGDSMVSRTALVLEGTSHYLYRIQREGTQRRQTFYSKEAQTPSSVKHHRTLGLAPWHRKGSKESMLSVSSSIHRLLLGKTPAPTPGPPDAKYTGYLGEEYPKGSEVDISDPRGPATFLPSEATRLNTPPMSPQVAGKYAARGFFFDLSPPVPTDESKTEGDNPSPKSGVTSPSLPLSLAPSIPPSSASHKAPRNQPSVTPGGRRRWDTDPEGANSGLKAGTRGFDLNVPEHLPNSPLCPRNPKHKSGGTGNQTPAQFTCPWRVVARDVEIDFVAKITNLEASTSSRPRILAQPVVDAAPRRMASSATSQQDPLLLLRQAIGSETPCIPTTTADASSASSVDLSLATATYLLFPAPVQISIPLTTHTRFISSDKPVDLRSIYFAWLKRESAIPEYNASARALTEELAAEGGAGGEIQNLPFVERLDLLTWLESASEESEFIKPLASDTLNAAASAQVAAGKVGGIVPVTSGAAGRQGKTIDPRLAEIYNGERRMGDRNSVLRGIKPTDFSHVRKLAAPFNARKAAQAAANLANNPTLPHNPKAPVRRPDPIILLSPSASSLLRMSNIKSFLEGGIYIPPESSSSTSSSSASILHITRTLPSIDPTRAMRFIIVDTPEQFKPEYWSRVVAVFTTGQVWQFKSYKWQQATDLFRHTLGVYVGWRGEQLPDTVKGWGRGVLGTQVEKWSAGASTASRWRDREVVEGIWKAVEENMRNKGWRRDSGPTVI
ncbi:Cell division control protein [Lachnellula suecica]|uniref:Cell division control protein n=1 Tax=Lachnellula suecica TaxID=602035 RepID=A0A8T9CHT3_9HELO|nr:Cell division control protein [Lachnellula suecica]